MLLRLFERSRESLRRFLISGILLLILLLVLLFLLFVLVTARGIFSAGVRVALIMVGPTDSRGSKILIPAPWSSCGLVEVRSCVVHFFVEMRAAVFSVQSS